MAAMAVGGAACSSSASPYPIMMGMAIGIVVYAAFHLLDRNKVVANVEVDVDGNALDTEASDTGASDTGATAHTEGRA